MPAVIIGQSNFHHLPINKFLYWHSLRIELCENGTTHSIFYQGSSLRDAKSSMTKFDLSVYCTAIPFAISSGLRHLYDLFNT